MQKRYCIVFLLFVNLVYYNTCRKLFLASVAKTPIDVVSFCELEDMNETMAENRTSATKATLEDFERARTYKIAIHYTVFILTLPVAGYLSDKYGAKHIISFSLAATALTSLISPAVQEKSKGNFIPTAFLNVMRGLSLGGMLPGVYSTLSHWIPYKMRSRAAIITLSGLPIGTVVHNIAVAPMYKANTNPSYVYGGVGILLFVVWLSSGSSTPQHCADLSSSEDLYFKTQMGNVVNNDKKEVPLVKILSALEVWALAVGMFGHLWFWNSNVIVMGDYMVKILGIEITKDSAWGVVPVVVMTLAALCAGFFSDWAINKHDIDPVVLRKTFTTLGTMGPSIFIIAGTVARCHKGLAKTIFTIAHSLTGFSFAGLRLISLDLSPNYSGMLAGIVYGFGDISGPLVSFTENKFTPNDSLAEYRKYFSMILGVCFFTTLFFTIFGTVDLKEWNVPPKNKSHRRSE